MSERNSHSDDGMQNGEPEAAADSSARTASESAPPVRSSKPHGTMKLPRRLISGKPSLAKPKKPRSKEKGTVEVLQAFDSEDEGGWENDDGPPKAGQSSSTLNSEDKRNGRDGKAGSGEVRTAKAAKEPELQPEFDNYEDYGREPAYREDYGPEEEVEEPRRPTSKASGGRRRDSSEDELDPRALAFFRTQEAQERELQAQRVLQEHQQQQQARLLASQRAQLAARQHARPRQRESDDDYSEDEVGHLAPVRGYGRVDSNSSRSPSPPRGYRGPAGGQERAGMTAIRPGPQYGRPPMQARPGMVPIGQQQMPGRSMMRPMGQQQPQFQQRPGQPQPRPGFRPPQPQQRPTRPPSAPEKPVPPPPDPLPAMRAELEAAEIALDNTTALLLAQKKITDEQAREFGRKAEEAATSYSRTIEALRSNLETFKRNFESEKARRKEAEKVAADATHRAAEDKKRADTVQGDFDALIKDNTASSTSYHARERETRDRLLELESRAVSAEAQLKSATTDLDREKAQVRFLAEEIAKLSSSGTTPATPRSYTALPDPVLAKKAQDQDMVISALRDKITKDGDWIRKLEAEVSQLRTRKSGFSILGIGGGDEEGPDKLRVTENELLRTRVELGAVSKDKTTVEGKLRQTEIAAQELQRNNEQLKGEVARWQAWYASLQAQGYIQPQPQQHAYYGGPTSPVVQYAGSPASQFSAAMGTPVQTYQQQVQPVVVQQTSTPALTPLERVPLPSKHLPRPHSETATLDTVVGETEKASSPEASVPSTAETLPVEESELHESPSGHAPISAANPDTRGPSPEPPRGGNVFADLDEGLANQSL